ncbi:hypothetical protein [Parachitinimonas caeni]|uniref:Primosomal replication protein PriB/PriC domain protein n=1 Tax=Parachitinimonas caeni TaxID=3031301 RepID=A0ABT7DVT3_9NEIS|nr:hypothetical protein [Parachitinimonas caeni]MDK2124158.1 hypothetical protein [Parachitinimonas caeni]
MSQSQDMINRYLAAEQAVLEGKTVSWGDRALTLENLSEIRAGRREWERRQQAEQRQQSGQGSLGFSVARLD